jgi:hypothetical protein
MQGLKGQGKPWDVQCVPVASSLLTASWRQPALCHSGLQLGRTISLPCLWVLCSCFSICTVWNNPAVHPLSLHKAEELLSAGTARGTCQVLGCLLGLGSSRT